jgi:Fe-S-cluster containining protein
MTPEEYRHLVENFPAIATAAIDYGFAVEIHGPCPLLAADHACTAYEHRARVCRMFPVAVTGHDGAAFTMAPSQYCPSALTVTAADIEQAKTLNAEFNAGMARSWKKYQADHPGASQMAVNFLVSRDPTQENPGDKQPEDTLASVIDTYASNLAKRKKR